MLRLSALMLLLHALAGPALATEHAWSSVGALAPREQTMSAQYRAPTADESALLHLLMAQAQQEAVADTDLLRSAERALASANPNVRSNAFASVALAMTALQSAAGERGPRRPTDLTALARPLVHSGLRDADGSVRRHALMAMASLEPAGTVSGQVTEVCLPLLDGDPEPMVRAMALECLLGPARGAAVDRALVERAIADRSPTVKSAGFNAAWVRQMPDYLPFMLRKLHDETDPMTRVAAAEVLRNVVPVATSVPMATWGG